MKGYKEMTIGGMITIAIIAGAYIYYTEKQDEEKRRQELIELVKKQKREQKEREERERKEKLIQDARPEEEKARERDELQRKAIERLESNEAYQAAKEREREIARNRKETEDSIKLLISKFENMEITSKYNTKAKKASVLKWKMLLKLSKLSKYIDMHVNELNQFDLKEVSKILDEYERPWKYINEFTEMPYDTKEKYLQSQDWHKLKSKRLKLASNQCEVKNCLNTKNLDLHHIDYHSLGNEDINDVRIVCRKCHDDIHEMYGYSRNGYFPI